MLQSKPFVTKTGWYSRERIFHTFDNQPTPDPLPGSKKIYDHIASRSITPVLFEAGPLSVSEFRRSWTGIHFWSFPYAYVAFFGGFDNAKNNHVWSLACTFEIAKRLSI